jgi:hypothetical protein
MAGTGLSGGRWISENRTDLLNSGWPQLSAASVRKVSRAHNPGLKTLARAADAGNSSCKSSLAASRPCKLYYTGRQRLDYNPYRNESVPYVIVGAMAEHKIATHVKLFLNLENLSNVRQTRWDALLLRNRESDGRWTVDAWAPLDGRVINGGARFVF